MHNFKIHPDVQRALDQGEPVLALESTIISHGMPYPQNVKMALELEEIARANGATPATIAVMNGVISIGLTGEDIEALAQAKDVRKLSRADLADCVSRGDMGATTVAATMILAQRAGIEVFATGGIGGVHQGAAESFDISADLHELSRTRMIVVSAGAKAILDLPKTYEMLETLGVPVYVYGAQEIPAFYSRQSGLRAPLIAHEPSEIAHAFALQKSLNLDAAFLINNPIDASDEIPQDEISPIIHQAIQEAQEMGISKKDVTPYLLQRIFELTNGRSLEANIALVKNNVQLGAQIALELAHNHVN